jgi:SAM-dependent methyltransferase
MQALAFLPAAAAALAAEPQSPATPRDSWNDVYTKPEQVVSPYPNRFLAEVIRSLRPGRALDVGMGQGRNTLHLARSGWTVTGVDVSDQGIAIANAQAKRFKVSIDAIVSDITTFDIGKDQWDLIVGCYMGDLVISEAARLAGALKQNGVLVVENYHRDINRPAMVGGEPIGYPVNALLNTFAPLLRIVRYEEVKDFPDWSNQSLEVPLVRMLARKG